MKEYTEIEITNANYSHEEILTFKRHLSFKFTERSLMMLVGGRPIAVENGNIKFATQGFNEGLSLSMANKGTKLELFKDTKRKDKVGDGLIKARYVEKAQIGDWKIEKGLDEQNSEEMILDIELSEADKQLLDLGNIPLAMEDKWFFCVDDNKLRLFRSWTGIEIAQGEWVKQENGFWFLDNVRMQTETIKDWGGLFFKSFLTTNIRMKKKILG